ncbi:hypothetical protein BV22DRAFT_1073973 [Leucogyrophana mollusca]|uniref:Uncharacterized protein n=1 Tax=Leucogyrophana mollusca TaxID=85980 RepID=A0ACB8B4T6_9AGAM|nr:hypothetical protein BV22DRAFT_1073973 [Leucogyrophana mollusca]
MSSPIIFYDIPSKLPGSAWSPNTWKTRVVLNIKGIPYKTEWVEYPDIEALALKIGASPTGTRRNGNPMYTLPIIQDPNTGKVVSDSFMIAEYLDATYPNGNTLFPLGTKPLFAAFEAGVSNAIRDIALLQMALICPMLNDPSEKFFRASREGIFGMKVEEFSPIGEKRDADLAKAKQSLATLDKWLLKSGGKYVMDDTISYADVILAGWFNWIRLVHGPDSAVWKDIAGWHGGRWRAHITNMQKFLVIY